MNTFEPSGDGTASAVSPLTVNGDGTANSSLVANNGDGTGTAYTLGELTVDGTVTPDFVPTSVGFIGEFGFEGPGQLTAVASPGFTGGLDVTAEGAFLVAGKPLRDITVDVLSVTGRQTSITVAGKTLTVKASF